MFFVRKNFVNKKNIITLCLIQVIFYGKLYFT